MKNIKFFKWCLWGILFVAIIYFIQLYYFFYLDVVKTEYSIIREQIPFKQPNAKEEYVSTWGAFGDFVGGTLNPIVGFLSVILLFITWSVTKQTLKITKQELEKSTEAFNLTAEAQKEIQKTQSIQQFDTIFFSMINNLNSVYQELIKNESELKKCYRKCFSEETEYTLLERRCFIDESHEFRKYFIILYQILKNIKKSFYSNSNFSNEEKESLSRLYASMLRSNLDNKVLQLLLLNIYKRFDGYSELIRDFRIFEHMDFRSISDKENYWNFILLQLVVEQGQQYFYSSDWYNELKKNQLLKNIFSWRGDFYTKNLFSLQYLKLFIGKKIDISFSEFELGILIHYDSLNRNNIRIGFKQGNQNLSSEIIIYRDKFLLKKADLYYQLVIDKKQIIISTSENKLRNFSPINSQNISIS